VHGPAVAIRRGGHVTEHGRIRALFDVVPLELDRLRHYLELHKQSSHQMSRSFVQHARPRTCCVYNGLGMYGCSQRSIELA
jgi:hypothetical protein